MKIQRCKGSRDLSPEEMIRFRLIEGAFRDCCLKWGYEEVRTPTLEYLHLFTSTGTLTPKLLSKVYSFLDWDGWSGERVVLRPDGTIPVARLYIESMGKKELARMFYVANVFIFEETGKKTRERWQCGVELIGVDSSSADVELIVLALEVLKGLKFENVELRLSHAGLIKGLLAKLGIKPEEQANIFAQILDGDTDTLTKIKPEKPELARALRTLLNLNGKSSEFLKSLKPLVPPNLADLTPSLDNFISIVDLLEALGCQYHIDITSGRGFEYYTGVIFQLFLDGEEIGGGGRYNDLIPLMGNKDTPASGFALYLDRLMELVSPELSTKPLTPKILVRAEAEVMKEGFSIAGCLRDAGYITELNLGSQELTDLRWTLDVKNEVPLFLLTDRVEHRKLELKTAAKVLAALGGASGDKDSVT